MCVPCNYIQGTHYGVCMNISLFYMSKVTFGGFISYTSHLCGAFRQMGHECNVYKVRKRTERKERDFNDGISSKNVSMEDALSIIERSDISIITATFWRGWSDPIRELILQGAEVIIHDHTDYTKDFRDFMIEWGVAPIVIRRCNVDNLKKDGLRSVFVPHPYVELEMPELRECDLHAVSVCRLDYDKKTHMIIEANERLPKDKQIQMFGIHTRMYMYQKIVGKYEGWDDPKQYIGPNYPKEHQKFPKTRGYAVELNARANFSCDMSAIKKDGGGTQYSFLEALNAGTVMVLNKEWFTGRSDDEMREGVNCLAVASVNELVELIGGRGRDEFYDIVDNGYDVLDAHSPEVVVPLMLDAMWDVRQ